MTKAGASPQFALTIAIPTFGRDGVLVDTLAALLAIKTQGDELLVVDQTSVHDAAAEARLHSWAGEGAIRWLRLPSPSITKAMNTALREARHEIVLFLDDDLIPDPALLDAHRMAHGRRTGAIAAGRVLQPWHGGRPESEDGKFGFNSLRPRELGEFMGGNFSVCRAEALAIGGFDENFVQVAYRFEAEFALRWRRSGRRIHYVPDALIHHLKAPSGGTRVHGEHLRTARPGHSVGEYYFLLVARPKGWFRSFLSRPIRSVATRHHLRRPWWIPVTLVAELGGMLWGFRLAWAGPRHAVSRFDRVVLSAQDQGIDSA